MLIILSPAKTMDMKTLGDTYPFTWPLFQQDADLLVGKCNNMVLKNCRNY